MNNIFRDSEEEKFQLFLEQRRLQESKDDEASLELLKKINSSETPKEALRYSDNKLRFDLIPIEPIIEVARVYTVGALKYADNNWRLGMPFSKCVASLERHWFKWKGGEEVDNETGCHHLAHVAWNAFTLLVYLLTGTGKDDRIKVGIDEDFNWKDNKLGIGLSKEKLTELQTKYKGNK